MPYLTPDELPEEDDCRPLLIPASTDWLAIVSGALTELVKEYNWQQEGSVTIEQAVARMQLMIDNYYSDPCGGCDIPEGGSVTRISLTGNWEQLIDGEWTTPEGVYEIPPVPPREGGTDEELMCLAAANAAQVFETLYEDITDLFVAHVSIAEAIVEVAGMLAVAIAAAIGSLAIGAIAIGLIAFGEFFDFMDFLTEDVWTTEFTRELKCLLLECASIDAGVVTFDYDCFHGKILGETLPFSWGLTEFRLAGQVGYLMSIMGAEGLNLAGATTEITEADCDDCEEGCISYTDDMQTSLGEDTHIGGVGGCTDLTFACLVGAGTLGTYNASGGRTGGGCINSVSHAAGNRAECWVDLGQMCVIEQTEFWTWNSGAGASFFGVFLWDEEGGYVGGASSSAPISDWHQSLVDWTTSPVARYLTFVMDTNFDGGAVKIDDIEIVVA